MFIYINAFAMIVRYSHAAYRWKTPSFCSLRCINTISSQSRKISNHTHCMYLNSNRTAWKNVWKLLFRLICSPSIGFTFPKTCIPITAYMKKSSTIRRATYGKACETIRTEFKHKRFWHGVECWPFAIWRIYINQPFFKLQDQGTVIYMKRQSTVYTSGRKDAGVLF